MAKAQGYIFSNHILGDDYVDQYMNYAKGMGFKLHQEVGIIIWGWTDEGIPSEIFFSPSAIPPDKSFNDFVKESLGGSQTLLYKVIFAPLRYNVPGLEEKMKSLKSISAILDKFNRNIKIGYGRITFHQFYINQDFPPDPTIYDISITVDGSSFPVKMKQLPEEYGFTVLFETIDF